MDQLVSHEGIVERIAGDIVYVSIISKSACSACHSKSMCSVSEMSEKTIEVTNKGNNTFNMGQKVNVSLTKKNGNLAVFFGYLLPFLLLIATLLISSTFFSELFSGLLSIGILLPYYAVLYMFRKQLAGRFEFRIS